MAFTAQKDYQAVDHGGLEGKALLKSTRPTLHCLKPTGASLDSVFYRTAASPAQYYGLWPIVVGRSRKYPQTFLSMAEGHDKCCSKSQSKVQILHVSDRLLAMHGDITCTRKCVLCLTRCIHLFQVAWASQLQAILFESSMLWVPHVVSCPYSFL